MIIEVYKSYILYVCIFFLPGFFSLEYGNHTDVSWYIFYLFVSFLRSHSPPEIAEAAETSSPMQGPHLLEPNVHPLSSTRIVTKILESYSFSRKFHENLNGQIRSNSQKLLDISSSYLNKSDVFLRPLGFRKKLREVFWKKSPGTWRQRLRSRAWRLPERRRVRARNFGPVAHGVVCHWWVKMWLHAKKPKNPSNLIILGGRIHVFLGDDL